MVGTFLIKMWMVLVESPPLMVMLRMVATILPLFVIRVVLLLAINIVKYSLTLICN
jgi:hypothetical protein